MERSSARRNSHPTTTFSNLHGRVAVPQNCQGNGKTRCPVARLPRHRASGRARSDRRLSRRQNPSPLWELDFMRLEAELLITTGEAAQAEQQYRKILELRAVPWAKLAWRSRSMPRSDSPECDQILEGLVQENDQYIDAYELLARHARAPATRSRPRRPRTSPQHFTPHQGQPDTQARRTRPRAWRRPAGGSAFSRGGPTREVFRFPESGGQRPTRRHSACPGKLADAESTVRDLERSMMGLPGSRACLELANAMLLGQKGARDKATRRWRWHSRIGRASVVSRRPQEASRGHLPGERPRRQGVASGTRDDP